MALSARAATHGGMEFRNSCFSRSRGVYEVAALTIAPAIAEPDGAYEPPLTAAERLSNLCACSPDNWLRNAAGPETLTLSFDTELPWSRDSPWETGPPIEAELPVSASRGVSVLPGAALGFAASPVVAMFSLDPESPETPVVPTEPDCRMGAAVGRISAGNAGTGFGCTLIVMYCPKTARAKPSALIVLHLYGRRPGADSGVRYRADTTAAIHSVGVNKRFSHSDLRRKEFGQRPTIFCNCSG